MQSQELITNSENRVCIIAANFTAEPLKDSLQYWFRELRLPIQVQFAPFDQIIQVLLGGLDALGKGSDFVAVFIQTERWYNPERDTDIATFEKKFDDFCHALSTAAQLGARRLFVVICPATPMAKGNPRLAEAERQLALRLNVITGIDVTTADEINTLYPQRNYEAQFDPYLNEHAQIPFTQLAFVTLGTILARRLYNLCKSPRKVIVVDCDNTLWSGLAGENGLDVVVTDGQREFQKLLVEQSKTGRLICLCSKNNPADALRIFDRHPSMVLRREHLTAWRINWEHKPANLGALSAELSLDLSSFIFIDDDKFECAAVRSVCPQVLTIEGPVQGDDVPSFFRNIWEFDIGQQTTEDRKRTQYYREDEERKHARQHVSSLNDFLTGLDLSVRFRHLAPADLQRAVQLLQRTNQFNLNGHRRSSVELSQLMPRDDYVLTVVNSSDRFGDYGDIGLLICRLGQDAVHVESFVLSCRALGRGIEHRIATELLRIASQYNMADIDFAYSITPKNEAVRRFLNAYGVRQNKGRWSAEVPIWRQSITVNEIKTSAESRGQSPLSSDRGITATQ